MTLHRHLNRPWGLNMPPEVDELIPPQRRSAALSHHHYPNILFDLWHHPQLSTPPSPPSSPSWRREPFAWCAVSVRGRGLTRCGRWLIPVCSLTPLPLCSVSPLKANLVAAFEQSLALMTARLQTLSVSSDQKVSNDANQRFTACLWWAAFEGTCAAFSSLCTTAHYQNEWNSPEVWCRQEAKKAKRNSWRSLNSWAVKCLNVCERDSTRWSACSGSEMWVKGFSGGISSLSSVTQHMPSWRWTLRVSLPQFPVQEL